MFVSLHFLKLGRLEIRVTTVYLDLMRCF